MKYDHSLIGFQLENELWSHVQIYMKYDHSLTEFQLENELWSSQPDLYHI